MLTFLHAADLHLDSPFQSLSPDQAAERRQEQRTLLARLANTVRESKADLLFLAGDLFDGQRARPETVQILYHTLEELEAEIFLSPGNHDPWTPGSPYGRLTWPDHVHIFSTRSPERIVLPHLDAVVYGSAFTSLHRMDGPLEGFRASAEDRKMSSFGCFHGDLSSPTSRYGPVTAEQIANQLRKTGGTVYRTEDVSVETDDGLALPLSAVNALRREALAKLDQARTAVPPRRVLPYVPPNTAKTPGEPPAFSLSFRRWSQVSPACLDQGPALVWLPAEEYAAHGAEIKETIAAWPAVRFGVTFPRVSWDRERPALEEALSAARKAGATEALLGHIGQLPLARQYSLTPRGDFGLGWLNSLTGAELARLGFASATASFEARLSQLRDLDKALDLELLVYGRLPLMLTENCILKNRGKGCHCHEGPQVLRDRKGEEFPVEQAWGCRNELFNAKVLWLADKAPDWQRIGARYARLSFLEEDRAACAGVFEAYRTGRGEAPGAFTRGLYYRGVE